VPADYGLPIKMLSEFGFDPRLLDEGMQIILDIARQDWAGETQYIQAVLAMMNARNVSDQITTDYGRLNQKRAKQGKTGLFEHHVIKISMRQKKRMAPRDPREGEHAEVRRHFCRGHWKCRRSGIFFWRPHVRGRSGFISKDYKITA
jgi:hypothetical protein